MYVWNETFSIPFIVENQNIFIETYSGNFFLYIKIPSEQHFSMLNVKQAIDLETAKNTKKMHNSVNIILTFFNVNETFACIYFIKLMFFLE